MVVNKAKHDYRFAQAVIKASQGHEGIIEPSYVYLPGVEGGDAIAKDLGVDYFAVPIEFGVEGAKKAYPIGALSEYESKLLVKAVEELNTNVSKGEAFVKAA